MQFFFSGEGVAIKVPGKGQKTSAENTTKTVLEKPKKYYQKRHPVTGFKQICLLHGNVPAHTYAIVMAFLKKEK